MIRPRIASVVSVVWLYLGSAWVLIGALGLYGYYSMQGALDALGAHKAEVPTIYLWFPPINWGVGGAGEPRWGRRWRGRCDGRRPECRRPQGWHGGHRSPAPAGHGHPPAEPTGRGPPGPYPSA